MEYQLKNKNIYIIVDYIEYTKNWKFIKQELGAKWNKSKKVWIIKENIEDALKILEKNNIQKATIKKEVKPKIPKEKEKILNSLWIGKKVAKDYSLKQLENMKKTLDNKIDNFGKDEDPSIAYGRAAQNREWKSFQRYNALRVKRNRILFTLKHYYNKTDINDVNESDLYEKLYEGAL